MKIQTISLTSHIKKRLIPFLFMFLVINSFSCHKKITINKNIVLIENINLMQEWSDSLLISLPNEQKFIFGNNTKINFKYMYNNKKEDNKINFYKNYFPKSENLEKPLLYTIPSHERYKKIKILFVAKNVFLKKNIHPQEKYDFIFLEEPNLKKIIQASKYKVKEAIICTGKYPQKRDIIPNPYRIKIVTSKSLTYWISTHQKKIIPIFFFSSRQRFLG